MKQKLLLFAMMLISITASAIKVGDNLTINGIKYVVTAENSSAYTENSETSISEIAYDKDVENLKITREQDITISDKVTTYTLSPVSLVDPSTASVDFANSTSFLTGRQAGKNVIEAMVSIYDDEGYLVAENVPSYVAAMESVPTSTFINLFKSTDISSANYSKMVYGSGDSFEIDATYTPTADDEIFYVAGMNPLYFFKTGTRAAQIRFNAISGYQFITTPYTTYNNCSETYTPTVITASLLQNNANVKSVNICGTINTIAEGAFVGCTSLNTFTVTGSNFIVVDGILYTYDMTALVAVPANKTGKLELPASVTKIYAGAFANVSNMEITSPLSSSEMTGIETIGGVNNVITFAGDAEITDYTITTTNSPSGIYTYNNGIRAYVATEGVLTAASAVKVLDELKEETDLAYIDLRNVEVPGAVDLGNIDGMMPNENCILILPNNTKATGSKNVVRVVVDDEGEEEMKAGTISINSEKTFYTPVAFTANKVNYTRQFTAGLHGTITLPFAISNTNTVKADGVQLTSYEDLFRVGKINSASPTKMTFGWQENVSSNVPYMMSMMSNADAIEVSGKVQFASSEFSPKAFTDQNTGVVVYPCGPYTASAIADVENYTVYGVSGKTGNLVKAKQGTNLSPFRAVFAILNSSTVSAAKDVISYEFVDEDEEDLTGVNNTKKADETINVVVENNNIIVKSSVEKKVTIATVSGALVFDGNVDGTRSFAVSNGIYVVNGKKCIVK